VGAADVCSARLNDACRVFSVGSGRG
jgi:hypothetical protein